MNKLDALIWTLTLEANTGGRAQSLKRYCERVISNLSDQGRLAKLTNYFPFEAACAVTVQLQNIGSIVCLVSSLI